MFPGAKQDPQRAPTLGCQLQAAQRAVRQVLSPCHHQGAGAGAQRLLHAPGRLGGRPARGDQQGAVEIDTRLRQGGGIGDEGGIDPHGPARLLSQRGEQRQQ